MISQRDSGYSLDDGKCFHREITLALLLMIKFLHESKIMWCIHIYIVQVKSLQMSR